MPSERTNNFPESGRGLGHMTPTIFDSTVGYPSDSLASCLQCHRNCVCAFVTVKKDCLLTTYFWYTTLLKFFVLVICTKKLATTNKISIAILLTKPYSDANGFKQKLTNSKQFHRIESN